MAKARRKESVKLLGVVRRKRAALLMSTALQATVVIVLSVPGLTAPAAAQPAPNAQPTGGAVIAGSATISHAPTTTTINQSTDRAALSWQTYNVGSQQTVVYHQPNSSSVTLNRIDDPNPSQIAGRIDANGHIVLMNQAGVTFLKGAQVNTNGLMVTAASMSDGAMKGFVNTGTMNFDKAANPNARVDNQGNITIKQAGLAALVAPSVANSGTITAQLGHVVMAGGTQTTLDMYGDGLVSFNVSKDVTTVPTGPDGKPVTALVTNTGVIRADGGTVQLTARQADGVVTTLVDAGGTISANSVGGRTGAVTLNGVGGNIVIDGQVSAAGQLAGTKGGNVEANASGNVTLASTARVDASGKAGGGTVALGTTLARAKDIKATPTQTASNVIVQHGATVTADATAKGNGGRITVLSKNVTQMNGLLTAKGGPQGGDGGFVETSGEYLGMTAGSVDVSAPMGAVGTWLLDPANLYIVSGTSGSGDQDTNFTSGSGTILAGGADTTNNQLSTGVLDNASGNVLLQAANTIDVTSSFSIGSGGLTMQAGSFLQVGSGVAVSASGDILAQTTASGSGIGIAGLLTSTSGSVTLLSAAGSGITLANFGTVSVPTAGKSIVLQTDTLSLNGGQILAPSGTVEIAPTTSGNTISLGHANSSGTLGLDNNFSGINATVLRLGEADGSTTASDIVLDANVNLGNVSTLDLHGSGSVFRSAGSFALTAGTLTGNIGGNFDLASGYSTGNTIAAVGSFTVGSGNQFQLLTNGGVTIAGPVNAGNHFYEADVSGSNPTIAITGSVGASGSMLLSSVSGTIGISGSLIAPQITLGTAATLQATGSAVIGQAGGTLTISAGGGFSEANTGTIAASILNEISAYGLGTLSLLGTANAITTVGSISNGGDFALVSNSALTVTDTLASTGNIFLQDSNPGGITVAAAGSVLAGSGKLASLQTDVLSNSGTITGGTIELAPYTPNSTIALGSGYLSSLTGLGAGTVRIGAVTQPDGTLVTTAGSIDITNPFGTSTVALDLRSTGSVTQSAALTASTLSAVVNNISLGGVSNQIGTLGDITATNSLLIASQSLVVAGILQSGSVGSTPNVGNTTTIGLAASAGTIQLGVPAGQAAVLNGGTVLFVALNGAVSEPNGTIIANDVVGVGSNNGGVTLAGTANNISAIGSFSVTGGGLTVASTGSLATFGAISAPNISLNAGTIGLGGSLNAGTVLALGATAGGVTETGNTVVAGTLTSGAGTGTIVGGVTLGGTANAIGTLGSVTLSSGDLSLTNTGSLSVGGPVGANNISLTSGTIGITGSLNAGTLLALGATAGGVSQAATSAINAPTLTSIGTIAGGMTLAGTANTIGTINALQAAGLFSVVNSQSMALSGLTSAGSAGTIDITTSSGGVTQGSAGTLIAGTLTSTGSIAGNALFQGTANQIGTITGLHAGGTLQVVDSTALKGTGTVAAPTISLSATGLTLDGALNAGTLLALGASATGVTEPGTAVISAPTLTSIGTIVGGVTLAGTANDIGSFGDFDYAGTLTLADSGSPFSINGILSAGTGDALVLDAKSISIGSGGTVNVGTLQLTTSNGGVSESATGTIITKALSIATTGSGDVSLLSPNNQIGETTGIQVANGNLILVDDPTLTLTGTHSANNLFFEVTNSSDAIAIGSTTTPAELTSTLGSGGRISLITNHVTENASSTITATNGTVEIAPFTSATAISLAGTSSSGLLVDPTLLGEISTTAGSLVIGRYTDVPNGGTIARTGGAISLDGTVNLTGGQAQTLLLDSNGAISEPGGPLSVNTLTGTAGASGTGAVALNQTTNDVGTLAAFGVDGGDFSLRNLDAGKLTVVGTVSANNISITAGTLDATSLINAGSGSATLVTTTGSLMQSGTVSASNDATLTASTTLTNATGGLISAGNTALVSGGPLLVNNGEITGTTLAALSAGEIDQHGGVSGGTVRETAGSLIDHTGTSSAGAGGTTLIATSGSIVQTGGLITALNGDVGLTAGRSILQTGGGQITTTGSLATVIALTANGTVAGDGITQDASGLIAASPTLGTVTLAAADVIGIGGSVLAQDAGAGVVSITAGGTATTGTVLTQDGVVAGGTVSETASKGDIVHDGDSTAGNGGVTLTADAGSISQGIGTIVTAGTTLALGTIGASGTGTVALTASGNITQGGSLISDGSLVSNGTTVTSGTTLYPLIQAVDGGLSLQAGGSILQNAGLIQTTGTAANTLSLHALGTNSTDGITLAALGTIASSNTNGVVSLTAAELLDMAGLVQATGTGGSVSAIAQGSSLMQSGTVSASNDATLTASTTLTNATGGLISAGSTALVSGGPLLVNNGQITGTTLASLSAGEIDQHGGVSGGTVRETAGSLIDHTGTSSAGAGGATLIATSGSIVQTGGLITALNGDVGLTAGRSILQTGGGQITTTGSLATVIALTANGTVAGDGITLAAPGTIASTNPNGTVSLTAAELLDMAGLVQATGTGGSVSAIAQGSSLMQSGTVLASKDATLTAKSGATLSIGGVLNAPTISVDAGLNKVAIGNGTTIFTSGTPRPTGPLKTTSYPTLNVDPGTYITAGSFQQTGVLAVMAISGNATTLRITISGGGPIAFDPASNQGLHGTNTWLFLDSGTSFISGVINVKSLDVDYGHPGGAELYGLVNNYTGHAAAGVSNIELTKNSQYRINGCPIGSVNCVLLPTEGIPTANPLDEIFLGSFFSQQDEADLLLPIVSDQDY